MRFPHYDYDDMVEAQHALLTRGSASTQLRLIMGTSMGCMHSFIWGETYPDFAEALMPLACQPMEIAGLNRMWRQLVIDGIESDPGLAGGNYNDTAGAGPAHRGVDPVRRRRRAALTPGAISDARSGHAYRRRARRERHEGASTQTTPSTSSTRRGTTIPGRSWRRSPRR